MQFFFGTNFIADISFAPMNAMVIYLAYNKLKNNVDLWYIQQ